MLPDVELVARNHREDIKTREFLEMSTQRRADAKRAFRGRGDHQRRFRADIQRNDLRNDSRERFPRVSFRVSLRWQNPKTEANERKPTKESENASRRPHSNIHRRPPRAAACTASPKRRTSVSRVSASGPANAALTSSANSAGVLAAQNTVSTEGCESANR